MRLKPVHRAALMNQRGGVSALCFSRPRAINLKQAVWTLSDESVTCPRCLEIIESRSRETEASR